MTSNISMTKVVALYNYEAQLRTREVMDMLIQEFFKKMIRKAKLWPQKN